MDATILLTADHDRVRGLFAKFQAAHESDDVQTMQQVVGKITTELKVHTTIEEEIFYPEVRRGGDEIEELVAEGAEEHHVVDVLMDELPGLEPGGEEWTAKVQVMIENVEHHAEEEEKEMFPLVRQAFDTEARSQLAERLEARKAELGAPTVADKEDLTVEQLRELAREQEIPGRSDMDRERLLATVDPA
ncbi:MAG TPA: hemerythrin domain-containing protein [Acidimicrobiales bacterium]